MIYEYTLSANTLFHFTNSSGNLENILKKEFYPRYCLEDFSIVIPKIRGLPLKPKERAIPMVSFCDIPLSQIRKHVGYYGRYAIGLTKEWGIKNNICPILYTYDQSELSAQFKSILVRALENMASTGINNIANIFNHWINIVKFVKPYEGRLWKDGKYLKKKIRFYDEREWRFCPNIPFIDKQKEDGPSNFLSKDSFLRHDEIQKESKILERFKLSFEPKDIKYIIVNKEDEILDMVNKVNQIKKVKYTPDDLRILTTRIISMEHIFEDF